MGRPDQLRHSDSPATGQTASTLHSIEYNLLHASIRTSFSISEKMSDSAEQGNKAGHAPAMKVGGMRVPLPKHVHEEKPAEVGASKEGAEANSDVAKTGGHNKPVVISGASIKEKDVYSAEAARAIHEKPMPTHNHATSGNQHAAAQEELSKQSTDTTQWTSLCRQL